MIVIANEFVGDPLVSVLILSYNQSSYIKETLNSVLNQKTNFNYEIIVADDCSTDQTKEILFDYQKAYPNLICLIINDENVGLIRNYTQSIQSYARGKYIAQCAADDYWIDPSKLQVQVDFLEKNSDYGMVYTNTKMYDQKKQLFINRSLIGDTNLSFEKLLMENTIPALTVMYKREYFVLAIDDEIYRQGFVMEDYPLWLYISQISKIGYIDRCTSVYRLLPNSLSNHQGGLKSVLFYGAILDIRLYFVEKYNCIDSYLNCLIPLFKKQLLMSFVYEDKRLSKKAIDFLSKYKKDTWIHHAIYLVVEKNNILTRTICKVKNAGVFLFRKIST